MIRFGSMVGGGVTLAIMLGCYTVSLKASGERKAVDGLRAEIAANRTNIDLLKAELRTRARMPELQRWNDEVLGLMPVSAGQFVRDPVELAAFEAPAALPPVRYAVAAAPRVAPAPVRSVAYVADADPALGGLVADGGAQATLQRVALR